MPTPRTSRRGRHGVTIDDVARSAGVSRQTVSRAINDKPEIDPDTRARILEVAHTLGYRPNRHARGMAGPATTTLGLVVADVLNPFFPEVVAGVMEAADERGWQVAVYSTGSALEREQRVAATVADHVDACVGYFFAESAIERVRGTGIPLVLLDHDTRPPAAGGVRIDFESGMRQALGHLMAAGHRRVVMLDDRARGDGADPHSRRALFLALAAEHGLDADGAPVVPVANSVQGGADGMDRVLAEHPATTAVLAYNDLIAVGAMRRALRRGLDVPDDCAFIGCDGLMLGELMDPPLTTLHVDKRQVGRAAVEQVAALVQGRGPFAERVIVPRLVIRESA
ncbi:MULTISPECIES: LacI family DNA-binding transcriptional regulator [unclassified Streptomyces]|uniref:LacI family DNA-binding transcriptional regulator n=1 Tax=unclassified Streptomyces TaxID=2593676 RepID=UPI002DDC6BE1|nr:MULTISPECIES: LacI family DNA-binding transcriptional regulator [unclassified Streptomyces]WSD93143.1 LacI family transcriptional regulator [Streptomyces sp. NBC_01474]